MYIRDVSVSTDTRTQTFMHLSSHNTHSLSQSSFLTHFLTLSFTPPYTFTLSHTHTYTLTYTYSHTHTQTHVLTQQPPHTQCQPGCAHRDIC